MKLHTRVFVSKERAAPLPIILLRTPYGVARAERAFVTELKTLAEGAPQVSRPRASAGGSSLRPRSPR